MTTKAADKEGGATATAEHEQPAAAPPTPQQTAAAEQAMGLAPVQQAAAPAARVPVRMGVAPTNLDEGWRLSQMLGRSELVPKNFRNKPEDILVAVQMGMELGLAPLQALASIAVINGRASIWGDGVLALIVSSPLYQDHDEFYEVDGARRDGLTVEDLKKESTTAVCTFVRRGKTTPVTRRFSVGQAKKAGLMTKSGPWSEYPDRMLSLRARGFAARDAFPDLLRGIKTAEEVADTPEDDAPVEAPREVRRLSQTVPADETRQPAQNTTTAAPAAPPVDVVTLGPVGIKGVEQFLGGFTIRLADGREVDTTEMGDAAELEKFVGSKHKVRLAVTHAPGGNPTLRSFEIAD